ncbi:MAG TPA: efflux RND transporter periplasmic adaptor subunit, partial [Methyloversatilis sp.]
MTKTFIARFGRRRIALLCALLAGLAFAGVRSMAKSAPATAGAVTSTPTDQVALPAGASQLSFIATAPAEEVELPLTEPLNARIALAEDSTARLFSPLQGRVLSTSVTVGDKVAAGAVLAQVDAPDLGQAAADLRRAEADVELRHKALVR